MAKKDKISSETKKAMLEFVTGNENPVTNSSSFKEDLNDKINKNPIADYFGDNTVTEKVNLTGDYGLLDYVEISVNELPCKYFYPENTKIFVKPLEVGEILSLSRMDTSYEPEVIRKIDEILKRTVLVEINNVQYDYTAIKYQDKPYLGLILSELSFKRPNRVLLKGYCKCEEKKEVTSYLIRNNVNVVSMPKELEEFYDKDKKAFCFTTEINEDWELYIPTIAVQNSVKKWYDLQENKDEEFVQLTKKIVPYIHGYNLYEIIYDDIQNMYNIIKEMDIETIMFLIDIIEKIKIGMSYIPVKCSCGLEVRIPAFFRSYRDIFRPFDGFKSFLRK